MLRAHYIVWFRIIAPSGGDVGSLYLQISNYFLIKYGLSFYSPAASPSRLIKSRGGDKHYAAGGQTLLEMSTLQACISLYIVNAATRFRFRK